METPSKIIFLDIDGVMNSGRSAVAYHIRDGKNGYRLASDHENDPKLDPMAVGMLRALVEETGSKIVISSMWQMYNTLTNFHEIFDHYGWDTREIIIDVTGHPSFSSHRGQNIQGWLDAHPVDKYVILDDSADMLDDQFGNFIHVDGQEGLSFKDFIQAQQILSDVETEHSK